MLVLQFLSLFGAIEKESRTLEIERDSHKQRASLRIYTIYGLAWLIFGQAKKRREEIGRAHV